MPPYENSDVNKRVRFACSGTVQGVGFRPFVHRLAIKHGLSGFVQNRPEGVVIEVEGTAAALESFRHSLLAELPPRARITQLKIQEQKVTGASGFQIIASAGEGMKEMSIPPDIALCEECRQELFDPKDRRFEYPFINCTNCGPRFTILRDIPYDRVNTSMACMPLCAECRAEYENIADRRFHAEPNACPVCGPFLWLANDKGETIETGNPLASAAEMLKKGWIVALKGLGGFHLAVDATNDSAVARLRKRKFREEKPLALMARDLASAASIAHIDAAEERLLNSPCAPIVLLAKKKGSPIAEVVAPGVPHQGIMLPYTPLHHLLLRDFLALVMTSANQVDEPICIGNREAIKRLSGIADFFLFHNRDILVRCDDSLLMIAAGRPRISRRARGFVPEAIALSKRYPSVLALGPQMKSTICILRGEKAFLSPHIGDLETPEARDFYRQSLSLSLRIAECEPDIVVCDLHPAYYTTLLAEKMTGVALVKVQHHHAHIVACLAENGLEGEVIGIAMDGSGYGSDGSVWGGEFLAANEATFQRKGYLRGFFLPGGKMAIHEPWRIGASLLENAYGERWRAVASSLSLLPDEQNSEWLEKIMHNERVSPQTSSLGRLFDGIAAIMGLHKKVSFEGQAALALEALAREASMSEPSSVSDALSGEAPSGGAYRYAIDRDGDSFVLDFFPLVCGVVKDLQASLALAQIALRFHNTLAIAFTEMAVLIRQETGLERVVLSGGCFQNGILLEGCEKELSQHGFAVFSHSLVPTNDGGVAFGQAIIAAARYEQGEQGAVFLPSPSSKMRKDYGL